MLTTAPPRHHIQDQYASCFLLFTEYLRSRPLSCFVPVSNRSEFLSLDFYQTTTNCTFEIRLATWSAWRHQPLQISVLAEQWTSQTTGGCFRKHLEPGAAGEQRDPELHPQSQMTQWELLEMFSGLIKSDTRWGLVHTAPPGHKQLSTVGLKRALLWKSHFKEKTKGLSPNERCEEILCCSKLDLMYLRVGLPIGSLISHCWEWASHSWEFKDALLGFLFELVTFNSGVQCHQNVCNWDSWTSGGVIEHTCTRLLVPDVTSMNQSNF